MANLQMLIYLGTFLLLVIMPLACCTVLADAVEAPKQAVFLLGSGLVLVCLGVGAVSKLWSLRGRPWLIKVTCAFYLWTVIATLLQGWHTYSCFSLLAALLCPVLALAWSSPQIMRPAESESPKPIAAMAIRIGGWLSIVGFIVSAYAYLQRITPLGLSLWGLPIADPLSWSHPHLSQERTIATFGNPDYFAAWTSVVLPVALYYISNLKSKLRQYTAGLMWLGLVLATVLTQTRAAWLGMLAATAVGLVLYLRLQNINKKKLVSVLALSLIMLAVAVWGVGSYQEKAGTEFSLQARIKSFTNLQDLSLRTRLYFWHSAWRTATESPLLGAGLGGQTYRALKDRDLEPKELRPLAKMPENVHNQYMQVLAETGFPGLLLLLASIFLYFKTLLPRRDLLSILLVSAGTAHWVGQFFICSTISTEVLWLLLLSLAALTTAQTGPSPEPEDSPAAPEPKISVLTWVVGSMLMLSFCLAATLIITTERLVWLGDDELGLAQQMYQSQRFTKQQILGKYNQAIESFRLAAQTSPLWTASRAYQRLGRCYEEIFALNYAYSASQKGADKTPAADTVSWDRGRENYQMAIAYSPDNPYAWLDLARLLSFNPYAQESLSIALEQALKLDPRNPSLLLFQAHFYQSLGNYPQALQLLNTVDAICPDLPQTLAQRATLCNQTQNYAECDRLLDRLLRLEPNNLSWRNLKKALQQDRLSKAAK